VSTTSMRIVLALVALVVAGFVVPYLLMTIGGGSNGATTTAPAREATR
jgi:hypothetical protein